MKRNFRWLLLLSLAFGMTALGNLGSVRQASAASTAGQGVTETKANGVFASGYQDLPLYSKDGTNQFTATGKTLSLDYPQYQSFGYIKADDGTLEAIDLGGDQWVKPADKFTANYPFEVPLDLGRKGIEAIDFGTRYYDSFKTPMKIYSDAAATQATGRTLDPSISEWQVVNTGVNNFGFPVTFDLGNNQWVSDRENRNASYQSSAPLAGAFLGLFTDGVAIPTYTTAELETAQGTLSPTKTLWPIEADVLDTDKLAHAYSIEGQGWVYRMDVLPIAATSNVLQGVVMYNGAGKAQGTIATTGAYRVFAVKNINNRVFLRLGNDNQWIDYQDL